MLHHIHKWKPLHVLQKSQILTPLSSLVFTKPSVSAVKFDDEPAAAAAAAAAIPNPRNTVSEVITGLGIFGLRKFLGNRYFRTMVSKLNQPEVDLIIESLSLESSDSAFVFFKFLRNECGFRHSRISEFMVAHVLATNRQFQELRSVVKQIVDEEGSLEEALEFSKDMERHGVQPDTVTYNILCKGFHLLGLMSGARKVIQQM